MQPGPLPRIGPLVFPSAVLRLTTTLMEPRGRPGLQVESISYKT